MDLWKPQGAARGRLEWQSKTEGRIKITEAWIPTLLKDQPDKKAREASLLQEFQAGLLLFSGLAYCGFLAMAWLFVAYQSGLLPLIGLAYCGLLAWLFADY